MRPLHKNLFRFAALGTALTLAAGCVPQREAPPEQEPIEQPRPQPMPTPPPPPPPVAWEDAPATPGDWSYRAGAVPTAQFGANAPLFVVRCESGRQVSLARVGDGTGNVLTVRTSYGARSLPAAAQQGRLVAVLPAADPLLDQIAFSRGRFAIEAAGTPMLVLPAWPEVTRVVEECRG